MEADSGIENLGLQDLESQGNKSALQHNIESKGSNAYYFAHAFKANGPQWDGKIEPKLLSKSESSVSVDSSNAALHRAKRGVFDYAKSTITKYGFLDEGSKVRIYIELGRTPTDEQIQLDYTEYSICLRISNTNGSDDFLSFSKLYGMIEMATYKLKPDRIIITLYKKKKIEVNKVTDDALTSEGISDEDTFDEWKTIGANANYNTDYDDFMD